MRYCHQPYCMVIRFSTPVTTWWHHEMETFSALLAICAGNSPVPGEFPAQRPVTQSFDVFFDLRLNKRLSKQSWGWWFETLSCPLWRHHNDLSIFQQRLHAVAEIYPYFHLFWLQNYMSLPIISCPSVAHFTCEFSIVIQIGWKFSLCGHIYHNQEIATKFCTCYDSSAVVACTKICSGVISGNGVNAKWTVHQILNISKIH